MGWAYSVDLRERVVAAFDRTGMSDVVLASAPNFASKSTSSSSTCAATAAAPAFPVPLVRIAKSLA